MPENVLPVAGGSNDGVPSGTPIPGGVETTAPVAVPATPVQPSTDAEDWRSKYEELHTQFTRDISQQKSTFQSQISRIENERQQERKNLEQELHKLRTASMDEPDRLKYENQLYSQKLSEYETQVGQYKQQVEDAQGFGSAIGAFAKLGIPVDRLDLDHGPDALAESGWRAVADRMAYLQSIAVGRAPAPVTPNPVQAARPVPRPGEVTPPQVVSAPGSTTTGRTWGEVTAQLTKEWGRPVTESDVYDAVEAGQLPHTIIPGLENT